MAKSNSMSTPKVPATPEVQNELRRGKKAAKRRASGGSDRSINPLALSAEALALLPKERRDFAPNRRRPEVLLGATRSAREVKQADKKSARRIEAQQKKAQLLDKFQQQVNLALVHPKFTVLVEGTPAHQVAKAILDAFPEARPDTAANVTKTSAAIEAARNALAGVSITVGARALGERAAREALREAGATMKDNERATAKATAPEPALV